MPRRSGADEMLLKVFSASPGARARPNAAALLREWRVPLRREIARSGAFSEYLVHQVMRLMIERSESLGLHVRGSRRGLKGQLLWLVSRLADFHEERQLPRVSL